MGFFALRETVSEVSVEEERRANAQGHEELASDEFGVGWWVHAFMVVEGEGVM